MGVFVMGVFVMGVFVMGVFVMGVFVMVRNRFSTCSSQMNWYSCCSRIQDYSILKAPRLSEDFMHLTELL